MTHDGFSSPLVSRQQDSGDGEHETRNDIPLHFPRFARPGKVSATSVGCSACSLTHQQPFLDRFLTSFPSNSGFRGRGIESAPRLPQIAPQKAHDRRHGDDSVRSLELYTGAAVIKRTVGAAEGGWSRRETQSRLS